MVFILKITKGNNFVNVFRMSIIDPCTSSDDALNLFILFAKISQRVSELLIGHNFLTKIFKRASFRKEM